MTLSTTAITELSAQEIGTAWLVLITLNHADLPNPIRVTSDGINTVSNGNLFYAYPFMVTLPDDVEGRIPQAQLQIDNTSQEIIAALRALTSPPLLTIQIVRASDPDIIEREWIGLEWRSSTYDVGLITGTLGLEDLAEEEFPYLTFDRSWAGLWP